MGAAAAADAFLVIRRDIAAESAPAGLRARRVTLVALLDMAETPQRIAS
jgi:hypothetical protein